MCFAPQADVVGGAVVTAIGVDACLHLKGRRDHILLAALPLVLGIHQLIESVVWWGSEGDLPHELTRTALWVYLLIAFVVLPIMVPLAVMALEPQRRRWRMVPFVGLGGAVSIRLLVAMVSGPLGVRVQPWHLEYSVRLGSGGVVVGLYVVAICGALLFSGYHHVFVFGLVNLVAVGLLAWLLIDGFASLWCGYAAITAGAITWHVRYAPPHRDTPYLLSV
ncbi:MAG TPA: DUF6629 family protein [Acidimicrobiales bacterium]|nr:DUF6629 family protein [Acidimicrobiales bacterium]